MNTIPRNEEYDLRVGDYVYANIGGEKVKCQVIPNAGENELDRLNEPAPHHVTFVRVTNPRNIGGDPIVDMNEHLFHPTMESLMIKNNRIRL